MTAPLRSSACPDFRQTRLNRRQLLQVGGLGLLGLNLPNLLRAAEADRGRRGKAKAVIFLHQFGGPSHLDTFDMKPAMPPIASAASSSRSPPMSPGIQVCEQLPRMAKVDGQGSPSSAAMTHDEEPQLGDLLQPDRPRAAAGRHPAARHAGAVPRLWLRRRSAVAGRERDADVSSPIRTCFATAPSRPGQHASFLGKAYDPLFITQDPNSPDFRLPELSLPADLSLERLEDRKQVMHLIDEQTELLEMSATAQGIDKFYDKALTMLTRPKVKEAFDLSAEPDRRARPLWPDDLRPGLPAGPAAGRGRLPVRHRLLLERHRRPERQPAAGTRTASTAIRCIRSSRSIFCRSPTQALPALLEDLDARGLLDERWSSGWANSAARRGSTTLAGRDHWPQCYTVLLAGGGVKRGAVCGASDRSGAYPGRATRSGPTTWRRRMFALLGIDPHTEIRDALNRPFPIAQGSPISGLLV